ncbi:hypothetical protein ACJOV8_005575 [Formosa sp. 3Alg 14/1]|uniref:hypothetical protein n=1 Tax=Formosa sp. 3Alg 14/1 TaxID=3382190 RepID=UPI0039BE5FD2
MNDKKNIDRLFQERLKDLDVPPNPEVWNALEAKLKEQNKPKRVIPIWWRASGVAAILVLLLAVGNFIYKANNSTITSPNIIADTPISTKIDSESNVTITQDKDEPRDDSNSETPHSTDKQPHLNKEENSTSIANKTKNNSVKNANENILATHKPVKGKKSSTPNALVKQDNNAKEKSILDTPSRTKTHNKIIDSTKDYQIVLNDKETPSKPVLAENSTLDTLSIEDAIAATKTLPKQDGRPKKWNVHSNLAPVFYGSTGEGSHLDDQFVNNSKSGEINTSYGIGVGYAINNRLKIRSGVNNLKLSFNTNDVFLFENPGLVNSKETPNLQHLSSDNQAQNLTFISSDKVDTNIASNSLAKSSEKGTINQNINYFEVPLEIEYNILNTRFGIHVIGGFSTFILGDNRIYSEVNSNKTFIGEATNINDISFSTNFGIGFDYNFSKRFYLNLEPTFKYQLNAFNNTSGNFKPYIIGVYTGFSYKF